MNEQWAFVQAVAWLIGEIERQGYTASFGDAFRDPRVFGGMGVRKGYGQASSFHKKRLAIDFNLFKDGAFLQGTDDHRPIGEAWEARFPGQATWGGNFNDGNHYSWGE